MTASTLSAERNRPLTAILVAGLVAGTIDLGAACLISGKDPIRICQTVAGGLLGRATFTMGTTSAAMGLVLQWAMSILIAAIYVIGTAGLPAVRRNWIVSGLGFGVVVFAVMNYVVVPLSAWHVTPKFTTQSFAENMAAMLLFGLIIAGFANSLAGVNKR